MKVLHVVGARPNFMKTAPIMAAMARRPERFDQVLVHTGQHYDDNMSNRFFQDLQMPPPDEFLNIGSGSHAVQTARVMQAFEPAILRHKPDWTFVVGDVNSTLACTLVGVKLGFRVAHVEAGLRSRDRTMPEEINRLATDHVADRLYTPSPDADENLIREGIPPRRIRLVGNVMIDSLVRMLPRARERPVLRDLAVPPGGYILATLHRPSNVDAPDTLRELLETLESIAARLPVVFPVHPRTLQRIETLGRASSAPGLRLIEPQGYLDFLALMVSARAVITDSGGVQEETTYLGVPCLTVRPNTERPITISKGTNRLVGGGREALLAAVDEALAVKPSAGEPQRPELWDGKAAERIVQDILEQQ